MFNTWLNASLGKPIDIDGAFGDQCVDVAMSWAEFRFPGHKWPELLGYGDAKDLFNAANGNFFEKLKSAPQQEDMVVFGATSTNPYGHIAVIISANGNMNVIEQNGFNPSGVAYTAQRPYINVIGYLRPKGDDMGPLLTSTDQVRKIYNEYGINIAGNDPILQKFVDDGAHELDLRKGIAGQVQNTLKVLQAQVDSNPAQAKLDQIKKLVA